MAVKSSENGKRKSGGGGSRFVVTLKCSPRRLRGVIRPETAAPVKEESPLKDDQGQEQLLPRPPQPQPQQQHQQQSLIQLRPPPPAPPSTAAVLPRLAPPSGNVNNVSNTSHNNDGSNGNSNNNNSDSNPATPGAGTPGAMAPPGETKKKTGKRAAGAANGVDPGKARGKPGPKKKQKLEEGVEITGRGTGGHRLGPRANQGAINAQLRALDRSGRPCRRWTKGGFTLKTFTGVTWEIPRWRAPAKADAEPSGNAGSAAVSTSSSSSNSTKENQPGSGSGSGSGGGGGGMVKSEANSNTGLDVEMVHGAVGSPATTPATGIGSAAAVAATPITAA